MEQQNMPEGRNLVFKMLFHSYSSNNHELVQERSVMDLQTIQCTTTLAKWRTIKDNVNSIDFFYFIYSCLHLHEIKKKAIYL